MGEVGVPGCAPDWEMETTLCPLPTKSRTTLDPTNPVPPRTVTTFLGSAAIASMGSWAVRLRAVREEIANFFKLPNLDPCPWNIEVDTTRRKTNHRDMPGLGLGLGLGLGDSAQMQTPPRPATIAGKIDTKRVITSVTPSSEWQKGACEDSSSSSSYISGRPIYYESNITPSQMQLPSLPDMEETKR